MEANGGMDWDALLDRLSACITPQEAAAVRQAAVDRGSPSHLRQLHNLVAGLLVKHGLTTWHKLHTSFPEYCDEGDDSRGGRSGARVALQEPGGQRTAEQNRDGDSSNHSFPGDTDDVGSEGGGAEEPCSSVSPGHSDEEPPAGRKRVSAHLTHPAEQPARKAAKTASADIENHEGNGYDAKSTMAECPRIVEWWHPTKNGKTQPGDLSQGCNKQVWLRCPGCPTCGEVHDWDAAANSLARRMDTFGCPFCTSTRGDFCSCLAVSGSARLLAEWHEDNPPPGTVNQGSNKKFKWRCAVADCGHVWEAMPLARRAEKSGCPQCVWKRMSRGRKHPSLAVGRPDMLCEWDEEKNTLLASEVSCGSDKKVWWLCKVCGNSWQASVSARVRAGTGCPKRHKKDSLE